MKPMDHRQLNEMVTELAFLTAMQKTSALPKTRIPRKGDPGSYEFPVSLTDWDDPLRSTGKEYLHTPQAHINRRMAEGSRDLDQALGRSRRLLRYGLPAALAVGVLGGAGVAALRARRRRDSTKQAQEDGRPPLAPPARSTPTQGSCGSCPKDLNQLLADFLAQSRRNSVKQAQEDGRPPLAALAEDVATPAAFGTAGYYLSKHFGLGGKTGLPDWFTGPALGLGVAMPMLRDYLKPRRRTPEQQMRLEQQAQAMLAGPVQYGMDGYGGPKYGSLQEAFQKIGQKPTGFRVPGDSAEQVAQKGQQTVQQTAQQQQQQQMQQAVAASVAKGYLSSLQQKQKPQAQPVGGRR